MTPSPEALMLFAAGFGTRMGDLTKDRPKPLIEVAGQPLIDHALDLVEELRPIRVVVNLHYLADQMAKHLASRNVMLSREEPQILETGGGLRAALPMLGPQPVYTFNSDAIWAGPNPLRLLKEAWDPDRMDALLICIPNEFALGHSGPGDFCQDSSGRITRGAGLIYGGAQIIKTDKLHQIREEAFSLNLIWDQIHADNRLFGLRYPGRWCDVGRPEGIALAESMIANV